MFIRRTAELNLLESQYASEGNNFVILYGRSGIGKTLLIKEFMEGKPAYYFAGTECEGRMLLSLMNNRWRDGSQPAYSDYLLLFSELTGRQEKKAVIILDEFYTLIKNAPELMEAFRLFENPHRPVMFLLSSSSIKWVENEMLEYMGGYASYITSYLKLKEFTFVDFVNRFPKESVETCIYINAIFGGVPDYLNYWREGRSVRDNILCNILNKNSRLFYEPQYFLKQELREPAVYHTILSALSLGNRKLNELHAITGYSRAKILVYLKHLIELDVVEKLVPLGEEGKENARKGLYRITDHFLSFWYRFVFPNLSDLLLSDTEKVYEEKIRPFLNQYICEYFADVCTEFLKLMDQHKRLPVSYLWWDRWYGKKGTIDILAKGPGEETLAGCCIWEDRMVDHTDYEKLITLCGEAKIVPADLYLFSKMGFIKDLRQLAVEQNNIHLVGLEDL